MTVIQICKNRSEIIPYRAYGKPVFLFGSFAQTSINAQKIQLGQAEDCHLSVTKDPGE